MYDIANYLSEFVCDNAYPLGTGVAYAKSNWPTEDEIVSLTRQYYLLTKGDGATWSLEDAECRQKVLEVKQCMVLNNYYWGVWAIMMLSDADETDNNVFNWDFAFGRCESHEMCVRDFGIG